MKNNTLKIIFAAIVLCFLLVACKPTPNVDDSGATVDGVNSVINANNQFALELYSKYKSDEGNIFFSPYSISTAVAMTYEGARGKTADEMQSVFHFPKDAIVRQPAFASIYNELNKGSSNYTLKTANALWAEKDYVFLQDYFTTVEKYYGGKVTNLDFKNDAENSRVTINKWVEEQTNNKIQNLMPPGTIDSFTRLVLTNAIYFKGNWVKQFDKKNTDEQNFKVTSSNTVKVQMMHKSDEKFKYAEMENIQVLEVPYSGDELSMLILLPKDDNLQALENSISIQKLTNWKNNLKEQNIDQLWLPKFKLETQYSMAEDLAGMGMPTAFSENDADFSGMTGNTDLYITAVIHKAYVDVNEEGTEAAAATGISMGTTSIGPMEPEILFIADHPFIFVIQETKTGNILFLGRVSDPTQ